MSEDNFDAEDPDKMAARLEELRARHRELDTQIDALERAGDQAFQIMTLKREKLRVKDHIAWLSSKLTPDIIA